MFGECIIITLFSLFLFAPNYISTYDLDLIGLATVIIIEIALYIAKLVSFCKDGNS